METNKSEHRQIEIIFACLILNYNLEQIIAFIQNEFKCNYIAAIVTVKKRIKTMAKSDNYNAITFCYQYGIKY